MQCEADPRNNSADELTSCRLFIDNPPDIIDRHNPPNLHRSQIGIDGYLRKHRTEGMC